MFILEKPLKILKELKRLRIQCYMINTYIKIEKLKNFSLNYSVKRIISRIAFNSYKKKLTKFEMKIMVKE